MARRISLLSSLRIGHLQSLTGKLVTPKIVLQYNTIRVYCENTLSYNNGVLSQTEPKSGSVKARQLIYRYSTNTIKLRVKKLDMDIYDMLKGNVIVRRHCVVQKMGAGRAGVLLCPVTWHNSQKLVLCLASVYR